MQYTSKAKSIFLIVLFEILNKQMISFAMSYNLLASHFICTRNPGQRPDYRIKFNANFTFGFQKINPDPEVKFRIIKYNLPSLQSVPKFFYPDVKISG